MPSSRSPSIHDLIQLRFSRRTLTRATAAAATVGWLGGCGRVLSASATTGFTSIPGSRADSVVVPDGYSSNVVIRWGDALKANVASLDASAVASGVLLESGAADRQALQFGFDCDGMAAFPVSQDRMVLCVNHEIANPSLMFPGWAETAAAGGAAQWTTQNPEAVRVMQAAVGVSVFVVERRDGHWQAVPSDVLNRRITAMTPVEFSGPAAEHEFLLGPAGEADAVGTLGNCAAGSTPWQTYLTAEENVQDFFGNGNAAELIAADQKVHERFGFRRRNSAYGWEYVDSRYDMTVRPRELFRYGWITEIDPFDPSLKPRKRTALGRFKHEGATVVLSVDNRVVVYMGDDQAFEYFYKFVSNGRYDATNRAANDKLLDNGVLYVAQLRADGSGVWLPLVWNANGTLSPRNGFRSQSDVVMNCRAAADILGATPLDRPEDVAVNPVTKSVYLSCTQNFERGSENARTAQRRGISSSADRANPRVRNSGGHILEFHEVGGDNAAESFNWEPLVIAGAVTDETLQVRVSFPMRSNDVYFAGFDDPTQISGFANPDNLTFDAQGNLWIVTDGAQPNGNNNGCFVCPTDGPLRGAVKQFMAGPIGAEVCGCEITPDQQTLFLTVQHPGAGGTVDQPISHWPDGGNAAARPSLIAIEANAVGGRLGDG